MAYFYFFLSYSKLGGRNILSCTVWPDLAMKLITITHFYTTALQ